jgi:predicted DNA-binding protein
MLDQRLVVLLESMEHTQLKELASQRGVSAASLVRDAIRQILAAGAHGELYCRESSPSYGSDLDDQLLHRLQELASDQGRSVAEFLRDLLDEHTTRRARDEARDRILERMRRGMFETSKRTWTRDELYDR